LFLKNEQIKLFDEETMDDAVVPGVEDGFEFYPFCTQLEVALLNIVVFVVDGESLVAAFAETVDSESCVVAIWYHHGVEGSEVGDNVAANLNRKKR